MGRDVGRPERVEGRRSLAPRLRAFLGSLPDRPLLSAALATVLVAATALVVLTPGFDTNDDPAMQGIVDGTTYGSPSEHVIFMHVIVGLVLKHAYLWVANVPWYGLLLYGLQSAAIVGILWALLRIGTRRLPYFGAALGLLVVAFLLPMTVRLQFTSVAILLGSAGVLVHTSALLTPSSSWLPHAVAGLYLGSADLIRSSGFRAAVLVGLPLLLWQLRLRREVLVRYAIFGVVCAAVVVAANAFDRAYYSSRPEWREYNEFNSVRGTLHGTPRLESSPALEAALPTIDWSKNDLRMFRFWYYADPERYSTDALRTIAQATSPHGQELPDAGGTLRHLVTSVLAPYTLAAAALIALAWMHSPRRARWLIVALVGASFALLAYLETFLRLPERVAIPILCFTAAGALLAAGTRGFRGHDRDAAAKHSSLRISLARGTIALILLATILSFVRARDDSTRFAERAAARDARSQLVHFATSRDAVIVSWGPGADIAGRSPLDPSRREQASIDRVVLGWPQRSPDWNDNLRRLGIDDLASAILVDDRVYVAAHVLTIDLFLDLFTRYAQEHYGVTPRHEVVFPASDGEVSPERILEELGVVVVQVEPAAAS